MSEETTEQIIKAVKHENEATRQHISSVVGDIRNDTELTKRRLQKVIEHIRKIGKAFGIGIEE